MTDKELRRSSRKELIEMLYYIRKELDDARAENERLNARFDLLLGNARVDQSAESDEAAASDAASETGMASEDDKTADPGTGSSGTDTDEKPDENGKS